MPSSAATGAAPPFAPDGGAQLLDRLLVDLRRGRGIDPVANGRALLAAASDTLETSAAVVWLAGADGTLVPTLHHPLGADGRAAPPSREALAADGAAPAIERPDGADTVLEAGLWVSGALAGALVLRRPAAAPWSDAERRFVVAIADRLAVEAVAERQRLAELALAQREQQVNRIESLAGMGSWSHDLARDEVTWSPEQMRIHGLDPDRAPRTTADFRALVHPDDRELVAETARRLIETHEPFTIDYRIVRPDGEVRLLHSVGQLVPGPDGRLSRMIGTSMDITERRATELALRASEESYRAIFDASQDAIFVHDLETGAVLDANRAACEASDVTLEHLRQSGLSIISNGPPPFTAERAMAYMRRAATGEPVRFEWMTIHPKTREEMWVEVNLQRVTIRGADRLLALVRDIRDRKVAEHALRASEESYRAIFQHASDAMWLHDIDSGAFLEVNQAAVEMYGWSVEEQKQLGVAGISDGHAPYTPEQGRRYLQRAAAGEPQRFEWLGRHKAGHSVWGEVGLRRVTIGGVDRILASARDINDRKAFEEELRRHNEALEQRVADRTAELAASNAALAQEVAEHERAKEALLQRTRELEGIFQALPDLYFRLDAEQRILDYRASSTDRLYVPPAVFLGKRLVEVMPPEISKLFDEVLANAAPGELATAEYRLPTGDELRDFEARFFPLGDGTRISVVRDITERKDAERALQESEAQLRETQRRARLGSWTWNVRTGEQEWDPVLCELYGVTPETAPRDFLEYLAHVHPEDRGLAREVTEHAVAERQSFAFDHRVLLPDGSVRHLHCRGNVVLGDDGVPLKMVGSAQDVSERKEAERALREREEHFRRLIENTSDIVTFLEADGTVRYQSPALERLLGYPSGSLDGMNAFALMHPDDVAHVTAAFMQLVNTPGVPRNSTYRYRHIDGSWRVLESTGRTLRDDTADEGVVLHTRDVTERKMAEEALARAKEDAERANKAKSEFLSRMSHELRTPMNSILGFAQLLARGELGPQQSKSVSHILKAGRHLLHLINEVLEIARIEAGRENFSLEPVSLVSVLQEAFGLVRPLAQQWEVELRDGPWPRAAYVQADRQRLVQVLLNLLSNAIKYNRRGGFVRLTCVETRDGWWTVRVEDSGRGIPSDRAGQLFTPFQRLGAEQTEVEGTGLGLALSRRLAEAMGGALALETTSPEGSTFRVDLVAAGDPLRVLEETGAHQVVAVPHREATLLYVEDNLANLNLVDTILLSRPGWRTLPALQGQLGVELAREHVPDIVLLDLHLPDISGEEVLRRLRADPRTASIPVVIVSADATVASLDRLRAAGADGYLTKPLDVDEFLRVVEGFLPPAGGPPSGGPPSGGPPSGGPPSGAPTPPPGTPVFGIRRLGGLR